MEQYFNCEYHKMSDGGEFDICTLKKIANSYDCYDEFLQRCRNCKDKRPVRTGVDKNVY